MVLLSVLLACGGEPVRTTETATDAAEPAFELARAGRYGTAAEAFLILAEQADSPRREFLQLNAAENLIKADRSTDAETLLESITPADLDSQAWQRILLAQIALDSHQDPAAALQALGKIILAELSEQRLAQFLSTRIRTLVALGDALAEAEDRARLEPLIEASHLVQQNRDALWRALRQVDPNQLGMIRLEPGDSFSGWVALANIANTSLYDPQLFQRELDFWAERYPGHPASESIINDLLNSSRNLAVKPRQIGVLLPFTGRYLPVANAVRDGLLAAWFNSQPAERPVLQFYDANVANIGSAYDKAINAGCDVIIGPLEREAVDILIERSPLPVPTLALNRMSEEKFNATSGSDLNFYQFGLSPEDEARQTAQRAWFDGHQSALVMSPDGEWGQRVLEAFRSEWQSLGGEILEQQNYIIETRDFIDPVKFLLNVDGSEQRVKMLQERLGRRVEFLPRRRQDADFIFLAAYPASGRQIRPHLRFYGAGSIPVYATSHIFSGRADAEADLDMDGIAFGDMPVIFDNDGQQFALAAQAKEFWPEREGGLTRLYALGADAYGILGHLGRLRTVSSLRVEGATGILSMDRQGRISRQLAWASFRGGIPRLVDGQTAER